MTNKKRAAIGHVLASLCFDDCRVENLSGRPDRAWLDAGENFGGDAETLVLEHSLVLSAVLLHDDLCEAKVGLGSAG